MSVIIEKLIREIQEVYLADSRPWIIGYSGGKDSTAVTQLVYSAIKKLPKEKRHKDVHIISADTLVDPPKIIDSLNNNLDAIRTQSKKDDLPIKVFKVKPKINNTFWVNLIGRGYPAPTKTFRWCTDRLKIDPANKFIKDTVTKFGEIIMLLGVRSQESNTRANTMQKHKVEGSLLSKHSSLPNAYVYSPIANFTTDEVWHFLLQNASPWGADNHQLLALYRQGADGDCPLVIDKGTPSCGNSRFGCWTCTVVTKDKTMTNLINNGEEWLLPLLLFRNELYETTLPENKSKFRRIKRRNGTITLKSKDKDAVIYGPYKFEFKQKLLRKLLTIQKEIRENINNPTFTIISLEELINIRQLWQEEENDYADFVKKIFLEVNKEELPIKNDDNDFYDMNSLKVLMDICEESQSNPTMLMKLLRVERQMDGMTRRVGIHSKLRAILKEVWEDEELALSNLIGNQKNIENKMDLLKL
jgi:DNA sulfur modification protein DndC